MINVITVKWGTLYGAEYVNRMYNMIKRNLSLPFQFYCLTDDSRDLLPEIRTKPLPYLPLTGWWYKPYAFKQNLFSEGDINFYIDLDSVITGNIDRFMTYEPHQFVGLRDLIYNKHPERKGFGSGIMRWPNNRYQFIWTRLERAPDLHTRYVGDQDYIYHYHANSIQFFPEEWTTSYKWEYQEGKHKADSSILVFHGHPRPHEVEDPIVQELWC